MGNEPEYIYRVVSNKPLNLSVGIGNMPSVHHEQGTENLMLRDRIQRASSNGAAQSVGLHMTLELLERNDWV